MENGKVQPRKMASEAFVLALTRSVGSPALLANFNWPSVTDLMIRRQSSVESMHV